MPKLNLETKTPSQELVKAYLEESASDVLAEKINNGVVIEKDGKRLINRKTLDSFMKYACDEARKQAEKGKNSACIPDSVVYGWAVHYFEEDSIEGTLCNEDGTEYKTAPSVKAKSTASVTSPKPQPKPQMSLFDLMETPKEEPKPELKAEIVPADYKPMLEDIVNCNIDDEHDDDEPTEEEMQEILAEIAEEEEHQAHEQQKPAGSPMYRQYLDIQSKYPDSVVAYRLGDFYEVFGDNAVKIAEELDLTLTGRDCGLESRIPMIGFPYHAADNYFRKLVECDYKLAVCETLDDVRVMDKLKSDVIDEETGEILSEEQMRKFDGDIEEPEDLLAQEKEIAKAFNPESVAVLDGLLGDIFILR